MSRNNSTLLLFIGFNIVIVFLSYVIPGRLGFWARVAALVAIVVAIAVYRWLLNKSKIKQVTENVNLGRFGVGIFNRKFFKSITIVFIIAELAISFSEKFGMQYNFVKFGQSIVLLFYLIYAALVLFSIRTRKD